MKGMREELKEKLRSTLRILNRVKTSEKFSSWIIVDHFMTFNIIVPSTNYQFFKNTDTYKLLLHCSKTLDVPDDVVLRNNSLHISILKNDSIILFTWQNLDINHHNNY